MQQILERLSPIILIWTGIAAFGVIVCSLALYILIDTYKGRKEQYAHIFPEVIEMVRYDIIVEIMRVVTQAIALIIIVLYVTGNALGDSIAWLLILMNFLVVTKSFVEYNIFRRLRRGG